MILLIALMMTVWQSEANTGPGGCEKRSVVVEGRVLDVYFCRGYSVALRGYAVNLSDCTPGKPSCLGQAFHPAGAGEWVHQAVSRTAPIEFRAHLAYFPFSFCVPDFPYPIIRNPYLSGDNLWIPAVLHRHQAGERRGIAMLGLTGAQEPPPECYLFHGVNLEETANSTEEVAEQVRVVLDFIVRTVKEVRKDVPIRRITAMYGYSEEYFRGSRFHEGLDTSWRLGGDPTVPPSHLQSIWTPIPLMPVIMRPGWALGMMPCTLARDGGRIRKVYGPYPDGGKEFLKAFEELERGTSPEHDCAVLFGGLHLFTMVQDTTFYRAAEALHSPHSGCRGKLPLECSPSFYVPGGGFVLPCATTPGFAGAIAPHCHYQAVALSGDQARRMLRIIRENPSVFFRDPQGLLESTTDFGGIYYEWIYTKSFDPMLVLFPELVWDTPGGIDGVLRAARRLPIPNVVKPYSSSVTRFVGWYDSFAEDYPGMPDGNIGDLERLRWDQMGPCEKVNKSLPGVNCRPRGWTYYNGYVLNGDSDPIFRTGRLKLALQSLFTVIRVARTPQR